MMGWHGPDAVARGPSATSATTFPCSRRRRCAPGIHVVHVDARSPRRHSDNRTGSPVRQRDLAHESESRLPARADQRHRRLPASGCERRRACSRKSGLAGAATTIRPVARSWSRRSVVTVAVMESGSARVNVPAARGGAMVCGVDPSPAGRRRHARVMMLVCTCAWS